MSTPRHFDVVILGGGTAGITVAARLRRAQRDLAIAVVEPNRDHYYQPLWTLVGGGIVSRNESVRAEADQIPDGVTWIRTRVTAIDADGHRVELADGQRLTWDQLVVALGIQIDWDRVEGLPAALGHDGVCSNYSFEHVPYTWEALRAFTGGRAVFTAPNTAVKCGGAPQKIMYLAEDHLRRRGIRDRSEVVFASGGSVIFGIDRYRPTFERIVAERGIETRFKRNLVAIRPGSKEAVFERLDEGGEEVIAYDLLHVVPPMSAPDVIKRSTIADSSGWVAVDKHTLQGRDHGDVFALGDCAGTPNSKTGAAVRKQAPVLVANLLAHRRGASLRASYDGYTSCPVVTGYGRLVLAEFDYDGNPKESFPIDQSQERWSMYLLKRHVLPQLYWHGMLKGLA